MASKYDIRLTIDGHVFREDVILSIQTDNSLCRDNFEIGYTACATIDFEMLAPDVTFSRMATIILEVRQAEKSSAPWKKKGVFYIDTRKFYGNYGDEKLTITGFDGMLKTAREVDYTGISFPAATTAVVQRIAQVAGLTVAPGTLDALDDGTTIPEPDGYTGREILGFIAALHGGSFRMTSEGTLQFVDLAAILEDSSKAFLITTTGACITFGGVRIRV